MIHEIKPKRYHVEYEDLNPLPEDTVFLFEGNGIYYRQDEETAVFPKLRDLGEPLDVYTAKGVKFRYLFSIDEERFFMPDVQGAETVVAPEGFTPSANSMFRITSPAHMAFAAATAQQIRQWYAARLFCGRCGEKTAHSDTERALVCPACGLIEYPKIAPVVIVGVIRGDSILVTRYKDRPGNYALVAGFCEIGESFEDAAHREVLEETGVHIKNLRYYKSQPWAMSSSLIAGFFCSLDGDPAISVEEAELSEALWLPREELPPLANTVALTAEMMEVFRTGEVRDE
jgi:NAD+ diphosphatase